MVEVGIEYMKGNKSMEENEMSLLEDEDALNKAVEAYNFYKLNKAAFKSVYAQDGAGDYEGENQDFDENFQQEYDFWKAKGAIESLVPDAFLLASYIFKKAFLPVLSENNVNVLNFECLPTYGESFPELVVDIGNDNGVEGWISVVMNTLNVLIAKEVDEGARIFGEDFDFFEKVEKKKRSYWQSETDFETDSLTIDYLDDTVIPELRKCAEEIIPVFSELVPEDEDIQEDEDDFQDDEEDEDEDDFQDDEEDEDEDDFQDDEENDEEDSEEER